MKLYKYGKCLMCLGTGRTWYNRACPYCDKGTALHEVSNKSLKAYILKNLSTTEKKELINLLNEQLEEEQDEEI